MSAALTCSCCNLVTEEHKMVKCSICKNIFKHSCVDLSTSEVRTIHSKKGLNWNCAKCSEIGGDIHALQVTLVELKNEISELRKAANNRNTCINLDNNQFEEILQEIKEREKRRCNVVIFGITENVNETNQTRAEQDHQIVADLLNAISVTTAENFKAIRIGRTDPTKNTSRPIKVTTDDESVVHAIIRNAKKLKETANYKKVTLSMDRTPRQIQHYRALKAELVERMDAGEVNLKIKYIRGVPKIIKLN